VMPAAALTGSANSANASDAHTYGRYFMRPQNCRSD
jgi:hypothetical protein